MKKILITGASGFLGSRIVEYYKNKYEIIAPRHGEMDITNEESVMQVFKEHKPDIVIHCAAISDVGRCEKEPEFSWKINVDGSVNMAKAAAKLNAKCILCSSDQVYFGSSVKEAHKEEEELEPCNVYGRQKLTAEEKCLEVNQDSVLLRLSWMYDDRTLNEGEHGDFMRTLLQSMAQGSKLCYPIHDVRGITDVNEVIKNMEMTFALPGGVYNFGAPNDKNTYDTVYEVFTKLGLDVTRIDKNLEAFQANPRNLSMNQIKLNAYGISFQDTACGIMRGIEQELSRKSK